MSRTYLALEQALNRRVVVKVLAPELLAGISVERFWREVLLAAQLLHPHVVPVLTAAMRAACRGSACEDRSAQPQVSEIRARVERLRTRTG
jgi:serine/threonine protein kinase